MDKLSRVFSAGLFLSELKQVRDQLSKSPYALLLIDTAIASILIRNGISNTVFLWVLGSAIIQVGRFYFIRNIVNKEVEPSTQEWMIVEFWFFAVGVTRILPVVLAFSVNNLETHYLMTMIMIGSAAGGVGTASGIVQAYAAWVLPLAIILVVKWLSHGTFEGMWIAGLLFVMFAMLIVAVQNYGKTLLRLRNEIQRADNERNRAERAVLAKTRFFAAASHDLRQPLGVLRWYGDAVSVYAKQLKHEQLVQIGEGIGRAIEHAEPLLRKYLDIAKIESGSVELKPQVFYVASLFEEIRDGFSFEAEQCGLTLRLEFASSANELAVFTDKSILRSILGNLVGNALKFTQSGEIILRAQLIHGPDNDFVRSSVIDTGIGVANADQARIFEDFFQVGNNERSKSKGMGLGLSIVKRQAQLLGTTIQLQSQLGVGSTFEFDLPISSTLPDEKPSTLPKWPPHGISGKRVLVIDDDSEIRTSLRIMLESLDWQVRTSPGLADALCELKRDFLPDAIIVDYRLKGEQSGVEIICELRAAGCLAPAVIVTGDTSPEKLSELAVTGFPVLHKPVQGEQLIAAINHSIAEGEIL